MNESFLIFALYGYCEICINETKEEFHKEKWYLIAKNIHRVISKKYRSNSLKDRDLTINRVQQLKKIDVDYFEDKEFASIVCVVLLLNYLEDNKIGTFARLHLGHYNTKKIISELEQSKVFKDLISSHHRFITYLEDNIK